MTSRSLFLSHSASLPLCLSLSDKLGDSLFCRKCSHHTDCRLVYSRFNLIIASPPFNQPASASFMLKPCYKHKIDFDTRRLAKLSQKKLNRATGWNGVFVVVVFFLLNISSVSLLWHFAPSLLEAKEWICFVPLSLWAFKTQRAMGDGGEGGNGCFCHS